jgi:hypothetical protein
MTSAHPEFAICIANQGYDDLEVWKMYRILPDPQAAEVGCLRVIDESGEDYLYPVNRFVQVTFSAKVRAQLLAAVGTKPSAPGTVTDGGC